METVAYVVFFAAILAYLGLTVWSIALMLRKRLVPPAVDWSAIATALVAAGAQAVVGRWGNVAVWAMLSALALVNLHFHRLTREYRRGTR